ncbi:MAG: PQQ-binding-like beta-propeller repeat protein, partial [Candidatus Hydrogenedentales bacterium]
MKFTCAVIVLTVATPTASAQPPIDWPVYGGDLGGQRHSPLTDISPDNVAQLEVAWTHRTGDTQLSPAYDDKAAFECTPVVVDGRMFVTTPASNVIALDPETGERIWRYDAGCRTNLSFSEITNRGVATWADPDLGTDDPLHRRVYVGTLDARLVCLDAATGKPCEDFGEDGVVNLKEGIERPALTDYQVTSPPSVINGRIVVGSSIGDNRRVDVESGVVRAFDARSGELLWRWYPIPQSDADPAWKTWAEGSTLTTGAANVWSVISVDEARDLVFLPVTSPSPDHYGGKRIGQNLYGNSVVALRGATGERVWHFQVVHHDLWDYDVPCQPVLAEIERDGLAIPVVIQGTKMGHVFVLHRETGEPVFPVEERPVPASDVPGEDAWPTQPFPTAPPPLLPPLPAEFEPWGESDEARAWAKEAR